MKSKRSFVTVSIFTAVTLSYISAEMFDFHLVEEYHNCTTYEQICKDLGYDGLAVVNTPEAYIYALRLSDSIRNVFNSDVYIGAHFQPGAGATLWDDGTAPRSDSPFFSFPPTADPALPCGRLDTWGMFRMGRRADTRPGLCGQHKNAPSQSVGTTWPGQRLLTSWREILSESPVSSYMECSLVCGMLHRCRAAQFNSDLLTCTLIGQYTSTGNVADPIVVTFLRKTF